MSVHGHYSQQYFATKEVQKESFLIAGISFFQENLKGISSKYTLSMEKDTTNEYDNDAIKILYNSNVIGYVPNEPFYKELCNYSINDKLVIININKANNIIGIRVIPEKYNCFKKVN
tara:strand:- start:47 stop:397 length:351 start_codon:yes stop_codon:yes gene_type:complete